MFTMCSKILVLKIWFLCGKYKFLDVQIQFYFLQSWQIWLHLTDQLLELAVGGVQILGVYRSESYMFKSSHFTPAIPIESGAGLFVMTKSQTQNFCVAQIWFVACFLVKNVWFKNISVVEQNIIFDIFYQHIYKNIQCYFRLKQSQRVPSLI